jgi:hypothetical protein
MVNFTDCADERTAMRLYILIAEGEFVAEHYLYGDKYWLVEMDGQLYRVERFEEFVKYETTTKEDWTKMVQSDYEAMAYDKALGYSV